MKRSKNLLAKVSIFIIKYVWQKNIGPKYKKRRDIICRFYPDCSNYAIRALRKHGFFKGWIMAYNRFNRCTNNNTESGVDYP